MFLTLTPRFVSFELKNRVWWSLLYLVRRGVDKRMDGHFQLACRRQQQEHSMEANLLGHLCIKRANKIRNFHAYNVHYRRCGSTVSLLQHCFFYIYISGCIGSSWPVSQFFFSQMEFNIYGDLLKLRECLLSIGSARCLNRPNTGNCRFT